MATRIGAAAAQAWPAFVLVSGLLLVGIAANADRLFELAGRQLERVPGSPATLLVAGMGLVAVVTALLNLDTAVVFLTPILVHAARERGAREAPFLYSAVFMANASSLYLPGSNLTNLLVLAHQPLSGAAFAGRLAAPALAATLATAVGLLVWFRGDLRERTGADRRRSCLDRAPVVGLAGVAAAAVLTVALRQPALWVLGVGALSVGVQVARRRLGVPAAIKGVGPALLAGLFVAALALGTLGRYWGGPAALLASAGRFGTAGIGAAAAVLVNNLPAAVLLSARHLAHPSALLVGLNLGPNLAPSGSLSALLWWRSARGVGAEPSIARYCKLGAVLAPAAIVIALAAISLLGALQ